MATRTQDSAARSRWIERANEYLLLAESMDDEPIPAPTMPEDQQAQQIQQQQQQQRQNDEDEG